jgi:hypothetical protein
MGLIAGAPDCGKSLFSRQLALAVASGAAEFCGLPLHGQHKRAIYVSTEDTIDSAQAILETQACAMGIREQSPGLRYLDAAGVAPESILKVLTKAVREAPVDLIVIDGWGDIFAGKDGNSNMEVRKVLHPYYAFCAHHECFILFVHHINKSAYDQRPRQGHVQGAAALTQKSRVALALQKESDGTRVLTVTKGNLIAEKHKQKELRLRLDPDTLLLHPIGFSDIKERKPDEEIDWDVIFGPHHRLTIAQLVDRAHEEYGVSRATVERWAREQLQRLDRGVYGRRATEEYMDPYDPD